MSRSVATWLLIIAGLATCCLVGWKLAVVCMTMSAFEFDNVIVDGATVWFCFSGSDYQSCMIPLEPWILGVLSVTCCLAGLVCFGERRGTRP